MSEDWKESLPEPLRDAPFIAKAESLEDAVGKITHAANHMGASIRLPDKNATEEQLEEYTAKLLERFPNLTYKPGEDDLPPASEDGYTLPEEIAWDGYDAARKEAMEAGLSRSQFVRLYGTKAQHEAAAREQVVSAHKEELGNLRKEWGEKFNDRIANLKQFAIDSEAPESVLEAIKNDQLDAASIRWLSKWADATVEKANNTSRDPTPISKLSPDEAVMKINEIMSHPGHWDETHPLHESLIRQRVELERKVPRA
jgi:hypothetical protein